MSDIDRRHFTRMKLAKPILGMVKGQSALILDIGMGGAFVEHYGAAKTGDRTTLSFNWKGEEIAFECEIARTDIIRPASGKGQAMVSHSAMEFKEPFGSSAERLQDMMAVFVGRMLAAHKSNAAAQDDGNGATLIQLGQARRSRTRGFLRYTFEGKAWTVLPTALGSQPPNGFTVGAYEDQEELETLCRAYEAADKEGRNLIRLVAELSVAAAKK
jgi:hypothetical protein